MSNSYDFVLIGDVIITGYGFTDEDDFLYILNKCTGEVIKKIKVEQAAEFIIKKDDLLYVRCYSTDYVFKIKND